ncbi:MAG: hypothetical protein QME83_00315 [Thermodesulfobacteriota bacterium]|nr:hypothetical protein [Thermodesulfobacteriota bacterium]
MDKQQRGILLADQEEAEQKINEIKNKLIPMGQFLKTLSEMLLLQPENIAFTNAKPPELGNAPFQTNLRYFNWDEFPQREDMARLIQDLRHEQNRLANIQRTLHPVTF